MNDVRVVLKELFRLNPHAKIDSFRFKLLELNSKEKRLGMGPQSLQKREELLSYLQYPRGFAIGIGQVQFSAFSVPHNKPRLGVRLSGRP